MKRLLIFLLFTLTFGVCMFAQTEEPEASTPPISFGIFETFIALVAFIPIVVEFLKRLIIPKATGLWVQIFSWAIGILITLAGWLLN
jgi:hypothetical protein